MRPRRTHLVFLAALAALISAALYGACFKPELGVEAFRCNDDSEACPEGYVCVPLTPADKRCIKEGHDPPIPDTGPPVEMGPPTEMGPPPDGGPPTLSCTPPTTVVATDLGGAALVLDQQGDPIVVYRNAAGIHHKSGKAGNWSAPVLVTMMPYSFAAAVDDQDRLHVIYTDAASKALYHCLRKIGDTTCLITKKFAESDLATVKELNSFDIASKGGETWAAVSVTDQADQRKGVLLKVKPNGPPVTDITYGKFKCEQKMTVGNPNMLEANVEVGSGHMVVSYWLDGDSADALRVFSYPLSLSVCTQGKENQLLTTDKPLRMPVAVGGGAVIHAAHGNFGPNMGLVHHYAWPFKSPTLMVPSKQTEVWSKTTAHPVSVDMALSGDTPVISLISDDTGPRRPVLLHGDPKAPGGWRQIPLPKLLAGHVAGDHTHVAVGANSIHVLYDGKAGAASSLFHIRCEGDLPK